MKNLTTIMEKSGFYLICMLLSGFLLVGSGHCMANGPGKGKSFIKSQIFDTSKFNKKLDIGVWGTNYTETKSGADIEYKLIADAGINLIWSDRYGEEQLADYKMKISEELGLRHIVPLWVEPKPTPELQKADYARWKAIVNKFMTYPAVIGFDMRDEPPYSELEVLYGAREYIESVVPEGKFAICNLHPSWQVDPKYTGPKGYEHYLTTYLQGVKPKILSFDNYPLREPNATPEVKENAIGHFINNLVLMRREAIKNEIPYWGFIQAVSWPDNRLPSKSEMRWLNNMHIVFGADGFSYFLWPDVDYYSGEPVSANHIPNERYYMIQQLNQELRAFDFMFVPFKQDGFIVKNLLNRYMEVIPGDVRKETYGNVKSIETTSPMINGCFDLNGQKAIYLFNFDMFNTAVATINFGAKTKYELWGNGGFESGKKGARSLDVSLEPGEGKFLIF